MRRQTAEVHPFIVTHRPGPTDEGMRDEIVTHKGVCMVANMHTHQHACSTVHTHTKASLCTKPNEPQAMINK